MSGIGGGACGLADGGASIAPSFPTTDSAAALPAKTKTLSTLERLFKESIKAL